MAFQLFLSQVYDLFREFTIPISKLFSMARLTDKDLLFWFLPTGVCRKCMCKLYEPTYAKTILGIAETHCHSQNTVIKLQNLVIYTL